MPHGESWLSYGNPIYVALLHWIESFGHAWLFGSHVTAQHIIAIVLVALVMLLLSVVARKQLVGAGDDILLETKFSARTVVELVMQFVLYVMQFAMPKKTALKHFPVIGTLGFFILFSNLLGLLPGFLPPTENFNTTFACGLIVFVYYNGYALSRLGLGHLAHMANPVGEPWGWFLAPLFFPIELISHCIRPCSLAIRLLCNIAGDHMVLTVFVGIFPWILPLPFLVLGLFVAMIQTFIFMLLSSVYVGEVESILEHHAHEHAQEDAAHGHGAAAAAH